MFFNDIKHGFVSVFKGIGHALASAYNWLSGDKVEKVITEGKMLLQYALPVAKRVSALTPTTVDDDIIATMEKLSLPVSVLFDESQKVLQRGAKLHLTTELFLQELIKIVTDGKKVDIGTTVLSTAEDILALDLTKLITAAQDAYNLVKNAAA